MNTAKLHELQIKSICEKLSNNEEVPFKEEWIEEAGERFKAALRKQFTPRPEEAFRLRGSNIGKPRCYLQNQKAGVKTDTRRDYTFIIRMLFGDSFECFMLPLMRMANLNITDLDAKVETELAGELIKGEDDLEIDDEVYDLKTCSAYAFDNKWNDGIEGLKKKDDFGYVGQLAFYGTAKNKPLGGWVVGSRGSCEIRVVGADLTDRQVKQEVTYLEDTIEFINADKPLQKCFKPEKEYFRRKPTGKLKVPMTCTFCDFLSHCWPDAEYLPNEASSARNPASYWYLPNDKESAKQHSKD